MAFKHKEGDVVSLRIKGRGNKTCRRLSFAACLNERCEV